MRIDFGLVLAIILEYVFFLYYADTLFYRKISKWKCWGIIGAGYLLHFVICMFGNIILNIVLFTGLNFLCFFLCYYVKWKEALFQSIIMVVTSFICELIVAFFPQTGIIPSKPVLMDSQQSLVLTLIGKSLYLAVLLVILKFFYKSKKKDTVSSFLFLSVPLLIIGILLMMLRANVSAAVLSVVCILLVLIVFILLWMNQKAISQDLELAELKQETTKEKNVLEEYFLLKEKYEKMNILHHDFREHMNALGVLIDNDNKKAKEYLYAICQEEEETQLIKYSDNDMLNILLSRKKEECQEKKIAFFIDPITADLSFLKETDIISIFSNLINNAMEGSEKSAKKEIFLNFYTVNKNFVVIQIENSADIKPLVIDGKLRTHKSNKNLHGIGMNSIKRTIKKYNGSLSWNYDNKEKIFKIKMILQNSINFDTTQAL